MPARIFSPFLMLLARLTDPELTRAVQFLKKENKVLRSKLGKKVQVTRPERRRLLKIAEPLGDAIKELITIVTYRTFLLGLAEGRRRRHDPYYGRWPVLNRPQVAYFEATGDSVATTAGRLRK